MMWDKPSYSSNIYILHTCSLCAKVTCRVGQTVDTRGISGVVFLSSTGWQLKFCVEVFPILKRSLLLNEILNVQFSNRKKHSV